MSHRTLVMVPRDVDAGELCTATGKIWECAEQYVVDVGSILFPAIVKFLYGAISSSRDPTILLASGNSAEKVA